MRGRYELVLRMDLQIDQRIELGAQFLDEHVPDWYDQIDIESLDIRCSHACAIGQIFGSFNRDAHKLGLNPQGREVIELGFAASLADEERDCEAECYLLTSAWKGAIMERRSKANAFAVA